MTLWKHSNVGRVVQVIGNVVDVEFASGQLPAIFNALRVVDEGELSTQKLEITVETVTTASFHLLDDTDRCAVCRRQPR